MGRLLFGIVTVIFGVVTLLWHDQLQSAWHLPGTAAFIYLTAVVEVAGGVAMLFRATANVGAFAVGAVYLMFALTWMSGVVGHPLVYDRWGNVFERLSLVAGPVVAFGATSPPSRSARTISRIGVLIFGICTISFAVEQAIYLRQTAAFVPAWFPPGQMFWAIATTIAFALAAISIVSGYKTRLAAPLLTAMLLLFGVAVWIPTILKDTNSHANWSETLVTFAIAGAAWIVADFLARSNPAISR